MAARSLHILLRPFPRGPLDLARQVVLLAVAYYAYRLTRGAIDDPQGAVVAFENARVIIALEQSLGLFWEAPVQDLNRSVGWLEDAAVLLYMNAQTGVLLAGLLFLYFFHNARFYFVRNMFVASMAIALTGYVLLPTAPPRFFSEYGFEDSLSLFTGVSHTDSLNLLFNPYAAVPSMHCCFAIFLGWTLGQVCRHRVSRALWRTYPFVMVWCVVVTGNHWVLDAVLGALTALASGWIATVAARAHPTAWAWQPTSRIAA